MSWSYSGNPKSSARDELRFLIGDTDTCDQLLQDEELTYLLDQTGSALSAAIRAAENLAAKFSRMVDESVGRISIKLSQRAEQYRALAADLRRRATTEASPYAGGISIVDRDRQDADTDRAPPAYRRDTHVDPGGQTAQPDPRWRR